MRSLRFLGSLRKGAMGEDDEVNVIVEIGDVQEQGIMKFVL